MQQTEAIESAREWQRARRVMPAGVHNPYHYEAPSPRYFTRAHAQYVYDADGRRFIDMDGGHSALIMGADHPEIVAAIKTQLEQGITLKGPYPVATDLAELVADRLPSAERVLFTDSGGKATSFAVRVARAHTGRDLMAKMRGGFHGSWDGALVGLPARYAPEERRGGSPGVPPGASSDAIVLPYNDLSACRAQVEQVASQLACIIVEPILGDGFVSPAPGFLEGLRELCDEVGSLLIFDEMVSFGVGRSGAQGLLGVTPDITALGKIIGGGLPIGGVVGREAVLRHVDGEVTTRQPVFGATFGGHALSVAAGAAQLRLLTEDVYTHLGELGARARTGVAKVAARHGVPLSATGHGRFVALHWNEDPIDTFDRHELCDSRALATVCAGLTDRGFTFSKGVRFNLSAPMAEADIDLYLAALDESVAVVG